MILIGGRESEEERGERGEKRGEKPDRKAKGKKNPPSSNGGCPLSPSPSSHPFAPRPPLAPHCSPYPMPPLPLSEVCGTLTQPVLPSRFAAAPAQSASIAPLPPFTVEPPLPPPLALLCPIPDWPQLGFTDPAHPSTKETSSSSQASPFQFHLGLVKFRSPRHPRLQLLSLFYFFSLGEDPVERRQRPSTACLGSQL